MNTTAEADNRLVNTTGSSIIVPSTAEGVALCAAFILSFVFIIVGNLLTIVLFAANRRLRKRSLFLVISMAFADLMLGTLSLPIYIYDLFGVNFKFGKFGYPMSLHIFYMIADTFFMFASLNSAAFISGERLYAIYWPLKHRALSMRAYCVIILIVWILPLPIAALWTALRLLVSTKYAMYAWMSNTLLQILIMCGCNIGIWRKFQGESIASQQQNRVSKSKRLTRTLLLLSALALLTWLPLTVLNCLINICEIQIPWKFYHLVVIINYSNSFVNPVVYALRIPEFREALAVCCLRRPVAPNIVDNKSGNNRNLALTLGTELRTLPTESSHPKLAFKNCVLDTKL